MVTPPCLHFMICAFCLLKFVNIFVFFKGPFINVTSNFLFTNSWIGKRSRFPPRTHVLRTRVLSTYSIQNHHRILMSFTNSFASMAVRSWELSLTRQFLFMRAFAGSFYFVYIFHFSFKGIFKITHYNCKILLLCAF